MLLPIHIAAGGLAIIVGFLALSVKKGGTIHRRAGLLFVWAMIVMGTSATILELRKTPIGPNVFAGFLTAYLVGTAMTTLRRPSAWTRRIDVAGLTVIVFFVLLNIARGVIAAANGVPSFFAFLFAGLWILAAIGDWRILRFGLPAGGKRLTRHLWRMCFALFIAAASFFSIRSRVARILPEPFTTMPMRALPIVLLLGAMLYWLWRARRGDTLSVRGAQ